MIRGVYASVKANSKTVGITGNWYLVAKNMTPAETTTIGKATYKSGWITVNEIKNYAYFQNLAD